MNSTPEMMEYNTQRTHMIIPEYGRNVQKMIDYVITIESKEERTILARSIVEVMAQLNPQMKELTDFKHTLWDHLYIISNFRLDVDAPYPPPTPETLDVKPERISYPSNRIEFRHYGKNLERIIEEVKKMEEGPRKDTMIITIANFMKMSYLNHNRDTVSDELIMQHLESLSNGELKPGESFRLDATSDLLQKSKVPERRISRPQAGNKKNTRRKPM